MALRGWSEAESNPRKVAEAGTACGKGQRTRPFLRVPWALSALRRLRGPILSQVPGLAEGFAQSLPDLNTAFWRTIPTFLPAPLLPLWFATWVADRKGQKATSGVTLRKGMERNPGFQIQLRNCEELKIED